MTTRREPGAKPGEVTEVPSPRTTIVGGRPPEDGAKLPPVPTGIQELLRLASVDGDFRRKLLDSRVDAAVAAGILLTSSEQAVLRAAPAEQLGLMIDSVPPGSPDRRSFLRGVAASAVTALGGVALASCPGPVGGARPDPPPPRPEERPAITTGIAPTVPPPPSRPTHNEMQSEGGAAPHPPPEIDRPEHRLQAPGGAAPDHPPAKKPRPDDDQK
jgi:hypothetical protein